MPSTGVPRGSGGRTSSRRMRSAEGRVGRLGQSGDPKIVRLRGRGVKRKTTRCSGCKWARCARCGGLPVPCSSAADPRSERRCPRWGAAGPRPWGGLSTAAGGVVHREHIARVFGSSPFASVPATFPSGGILASGSTRLGQIPSVRSQGEVRGVSGATARGSTLGGRQTRESASDSWPESSPKDRGVGI